MVFTLLYFELHHSMARQSRNVFFCLTRQTKARKNENHNSTDLLLIYNSLEKPTEFVIKHKETTILGKKSPEENSRKLSSILIKPCFDRLHRCKRSITYHLHDRRLLSNPSQNQFSGRLGWVGRMNQTTGCPIWRYSESE